MGLAADTMPAMALWDIDMPGMCMPCIPYWARTLAGKPENNYKYYQ